MNKPDQQMDVYSGVRWSAVATYGCQTVQLVTSIVLARLLAPEYFVLPSDMQERLRTMWDPDAGTVSAKASAEGRWDGFLAGMAMFEDYPVFGVGVDNFVFYRAVHVDGVGLDAHNLEGALFGETGIIGVMCFGLVILATLRNCRKVRRLAVLHDDHELAVLGQLALACRDGLILLIVLGQFSYNLQRFNWLWIAAFCSLAATFAFHRKAKIDFFSNRNAAL